MRGGAGVRGNGRNANAAAGETERKDFTLERGGRGHTVRWFETKCSERTQIRGEVKTSIFVNQVDTAPTGRNLGKEEIEVRKTEGRGKGKGGLHIHAWPRGRLRG